MSRNLVLLIPAHLAQLPILVPKLLFGNPLQETLFRLKTNAKRSFKAWVPKQEFGNQDRTPFPNSYSSIRRLHAMSEKVLT